MEETKESTAKSKDNDENPILDNKSFTKIMHLSISGEEVDNSFLEEDARSLDAAEDALYDRVQHLEEMWEEE